MAVQAAGQFGPPLILKAITRHFFGIDLLSTSELWTLISLLFVIPVVGVLCASKSNVIFAHAASIIRSALIPAIYQKSLSLGASAKQEFSSGQILNLFSNDIQHIQLFVQVTRRP
jgi:ABC-type multidrug transport system fused ATPase/permease subunit